jgi:hypothetical protein
MKAKLFTLAVMVLAAGFVGYRIGFSAMGQAWKRSNSDVYRRVSHFDRLHEVSINTQVLQYLADGNVSKAREVLERGLDDALVHLFSYEELHNPEGRDGFDLEVVRAARDYRSHHPWTSRPTGLEAVRQELVPQEKVQEVFKWAD